MHDVIVIGGGIAGLSCAWKLMEQGLDVHVLENAEHIGGNIRTVEHEGYRLEVGPYSFLGGSEYMWRMLEELGIEDLPIPSSAAADNRFIYRDGKLMAMPLSLWGFLSTRLLSFKAKLRLMIEPLIPSGAKPDDTAWEFFVRRFGVEAATYIMGPFVSGIYAGDPKLLGTRAAFQKFYEFERDSGSLIIGAVKYMLAKRKRMAKEKRKSRKGLYSFNGGLGEITTILAKRLEGRLTLNAGVSEVSRDNGVFQVHTTAAKLAAHCVVSAVPPPSAARILGEMAPGVVEPFKAIPMSPVALVHWSQPEVNNKFPEGFGLLMPRHYGLRVLGTIFSSQLFPGRAPRGKLLISSFYGGMCDKQAMDLDDNELRKLLLEEHTEIFGFALTEPEMFKVFRYPGAIPQLLPDHPERIATIRGNLARFPGLYLAGNYITGVGIEHAVTSGYHAAHEASEFFAQIPQSGAEEE